MNRANIKIKKDYVPKAKRMEQAIKQHRAHVVATIASKAGMDGSRGGIGAPPLTSASAALKQKCPQCNQLVPVDELERHMRIELLDPKWKEQKERQLSKKRESNLVLDSGREVAASLEKFAQVRRDIFGGDEYETRKQIEEQKKKADSRAQPTWDGRYATIARVRDQASHIAMMPETQAEWLRQQAELAAKQVGPRVPVTGAPGRTVASIPVTEHAAASMPVSTPQQQHAGSSAQSGAAPPATSAQAAAQYAEMYARMQQQQQARVRQLEGSSDASVLTAAVTARPPPSSTRDEGA